MLIRSVFSIIIIPIKYIISNIITIVTFDVLLNLQIGVLLFTVMLNNKSI